MGVIDRTDRLLVMILLQLMEKAPQAKKIYHLNLAGLSNIEIADALETSPQVVSQSLYEVRKGQQKKPAKTKTRKKPARRN